MKKAILMVAGTAVQKFMMTLSKEQEIIMNIADMMIDTYLAESVLLRVEQLVSMKGKEAAAVQLDILQVFINDAMNRLQVNGKTAVNCMSEGDEQRMMAMGLKRFTKYTPVNTKEARRRIAKELCEAGNYCF